MDNFEIPPSIRDAFYAAVWDIARQIPSGKVSTYGQIASFIPMPDSVTEADYKASRARWVGSAMNACPNDVPWQRVINAQGKIALRSGAERQRRMLEAEGVPFDSRDRVDMLRFAWEGPAPEWLRAHQLIVPEIKPGYKEQSLF